MKVFEIVEGLEHPLTGEKQRWADKNGKDITPSAAKKAIVAGKQSTEGKRYPAHVVAWAKALRKHLASIDIPNVTFKEGTGNIAAFSGNERLATYELDYREARYTNKRYEPKDVSA